MPPGTLTLAHPHQGDRAVASGWTVLQYLLLGVHVHADRARVRLQRRGLSTLRLLRPLRHQRRIPHHPPWGWRGEWRERERLPFLALLLSFCRMLPLRVVLQGMDRTMHCPFC